MRFLSGLFLCLLLGNASFAQSDNPISNNWVTNGTVNAIVHDNNTNTTYIGGNFSSVGPNTPYGTGIDIITGQPNVNFAKPNGVIIATISDGSGGWYIGGEFTSINGVARNRIARINSDGTLHPWNPNANSDVISLALSGSTVYAGGWFTSIGGQTRNYIAAIDASTGNATAWNPNASSGVYSLALSGSMVYAGGLFTIIGGQTRNYIAAIDASTGNATAWNPNADNPVYSLALSGSTVYAGGNFFSIGGQPRNKIAAIDASTGSATSWNPSADGLVLSLALSGSTVYAGGSFTSIGGQSRSRIAAIDASTGNATAWNPNANITVWSLALSGSTIYAGGDFTSIGGQSRNRIAAIDASTGNATAWNPNANSTVRSLALSGSTVYAGGNFTSIGGETRNRIAAIDASTGNATAWNPNANGNVITLALNGSTVYAGGLFTNIGGQTRNYIAALDASTGNATSWNPNANSFVRSFAINESILYVGGDFSNIGGQTRSRIAAIDVSTGNATAWNPIANGVVNSIALSSSSVVYVGGNFTGIGGESRKNIAALDGNTGNATSWNPDANNAVNSLILSGSTIYAGGFFTSIGGETRNRIAALDANNGSAKSWNPDANGSIHSLVLSNSIVYVGGDFTDIGGQIRNKLAALDASTGYATAWNPSANLLVFSLALSGSSLYAGGNFSFIGSKQRQGFAAFPLSVSWGGSEGGNWDVDSNWTPRSVPTRTTNITVNSGYPVINVDHTIDVGHSLTLSGSGGLVVDTSKMLTIAGTAAFGGKPVTLKSGPWGTASIGRITGTLTGASNVTVERYIPAGLKWRGLSVPLSSATAGNSIFNSWQNNGSVIAGQGVLLWSPTAQTGFSLNTNTNASQNIRKYIGGSGFSLLSNTNEPLFSSGKPVPYLVFVTDHYKQNPNVADMGSTASATTLRATGTLYQGNYESGSLGTGFHMIPNPYPAAINFNNATKSGGVGNQFWIWDPQIFGFSGYGGYQTYSSGVIAPSGGSYFSSDQDSIIPSGAAFWVYSDGGGAINMSESTKKVTSSTLSVFRQHSSSQNKVLRVNLMDGTKLLDGVAAAFNTNASLDIDKLDARKFGLGAENIFIRRNQMNLAIEFHPAVQANDTIYLGLNQLSQKPYSLQLSGNNFEINTNTIAVLEDLYLNKETTIDLQGTTKVDFTVNEQPASSGNRFRVVFRSNALTPVSTLDADKGMSIYPNPVQKGGMVQLQLNNQPAGEYRLVLFDISGVQVMNKVLQHGGGTAVQSVSVSDKLAAGNYVAELTDMKGKSQQIKITIQ